MSESPTRRRGAALEAAILAAAWEVLAEAGPAAFTYEAVAARAGTSRPVLYRRWPQRQDLLLATLARAWQAEPIGLPDTGSLRGDALAFLGSANAARSRAMVTVGAQLLAVLGETDGSLAAFRAALSQGAGSPCAAILARAVARGELRRVPAATRVVELPFDLLRHDVLMGRGPLPDTALAAIVDDVWLPLLKVHDADQAP